MITWKDLADDEAMKEATNELGRWAEREAGERKLLANFTYLNYANGEQSVYERSLTSEDLDKMLKIRDAYDPLKSFQQLWKGGFKLPGTAHHGDVLRDEL
jgi:hypothetical protein